MSAESRRAARWIVGSKVLSKIADTLVDPKTVLTWMLNAVESPGWILGALVPLRESGSMLPQVWLSRFVQSREVRARVCLVAALGQGFAAAVMAGAAWGMDASSAGWTVLLALAAFSGFRALSSIASKDVLAGAIPKGERGAVNGNASSLAGIVGAGLGVLAAALGQDIRSPEAYALVVLAGAICFFGVALCFRMLMGTTAQGEEKTGAPASLRELWGHSIARRFIISRSLLTGTALGAPSFVTFGQSKQGSLSALAIFVLASGVASGVSSSRWGKLADRGGQKPMIWGGVVSLVAGMVALGLQSFGDGVSLHWLVWPAIYFVFSIGYAGVRVGRKTYIVDIVKGNRRTALVATSNTVIALVLIVMGALGAWVATQSQLLAFGGYVAMVAVGVLSCFFLPSPFGQDAESA